VTRSPHGLRLGRLLGVPIYLPLAGPALLLVVTASYAILLTRLIPRAAPAAVLLAAGCFAVLLTGSLLAHDLGHVAACRSLRLPVDRVVVSPLATGSVHAEPGGPGPECLVAVAGPLVTAGLLGLAALCAARTGSGTLPHAVLVLLAAANVLLLLFHLLPGMPADGGRVARAAAWWLSGSRATGTLVAAGLGRLLAMVAALIALMIAPAAGAAGLAGVAVTAGVAGLLWTGSAGSRDTAGGVGGGGPSPDKGHAGMGGRRWAGLLLVAAGVATLVPAYVGQTYRVASGSMRDTLRPGDRVLADKVFYRARGVHRGDLIVFRRPPGLEVPERDLVKRVIGLPGDRIEGRDGRILVNGRALAEAYLQRDCGEGSGRIPAITVPAGRLYVLGDNRCQSSDSRSFGPVDTHRVEGRAVLVVWPPSRAGTLS